MKIAIFHCEEVPTLFMMEESARKVGFEPFVFHFRDIEFYVNEKDFDVKARGVSLKDFSLIYCRGFWSYQMEVSLLVEFCKRKKIPIFDSALLHRQFISKIYDLEFFKAHGFPVPKTLFLGGKISKEILMKEIGLPIVAKEDRSRKGNNVYLFQTEKDLEDFLEKIYIEDKTLSTPTYQFQEFIPADFDVRVIVVGGRVLGAIERRSQDPDEFRHNISLGGHAMQIPVTPEMEDLALRSTNVLKYEFAGVDLITHKKTGETYLLEVNRSPWFEGFVNATSIDVALELMKFFLHSIKQGA